MPDQKFSTGLQAESKQLVKCVILEKSDIQSWFLDPFDGSLCEQNFENTTRKKKFILSSFQTSSNHHTTAGSEVGTRQCQV